MIPSLPVISHQDALEFRKSMNNQLEQHIHVPNPTVPQWSLTYSPESLSALIIPNPLLSKLSSLLFLVIREDLQSALLTPRGGTFSTGKVSCLEDCKGAVMLVVLQRKQGDSCFGGTFFVIDVLSYNGVPLKEPYEQRYQVSQAISSMFTFSPRFKFSLCSRVTGNQAKGINEFATPVYLIKDV
jgi:hypothetical protein